MADGAGAAIRVLRLLNGDGSGDYEHVRLYVVGTSSSRPSPAAPAAALRRRLAGLEIREYLRRGCAQPVGLPRHLVAGADEASATNLIGTGLLLSLGAVRRPAAAGQ